MLRFNNLLQECGIDPANVRLLRHQPDVAGRPLLEVWRTDRNLFETYQSRQSTSARASFARPYWASFIGTLDGRTLFVGLYEVLEGCCQSNANRSPHDAGRSLKLAA